MYFIYDNNKIIKNFIIGLILEFILTFNLNIKIFNIESTIYVKESRLL
jgi:hypothetical protein